MVSLLRPCAVQVEVPSWRVFTRTITMCWPTTKIVLQLSGLSSMSPELLPNTFMTPDTRQVGKQFYCQSYGVEKHNLRHGLQKMRNWGTLVNWTLLLVPHFPSWNEDLCKTENAELRKQRNCDNSNFFVSSAFSKSENCTENRTSLLVPHFPCWYLDFLNTENAEPNIDLLDLLVSLVPILVPLFRFSVDPNLRSFIKVIFQ